MVGITRPIILDFVLAIGITLTQPYLVFGAGQSFSRSGSFRDPRMHRQHPFSQPFHRFGVFGGDGLGDQQVVIIQQVQSAPTIGFREPARNEIYVPPRWVDGGYGVQVLQGGYWTVPKQAAEP
jgi:hypothetical protein